MTHAPIVLSLGLLFGVAGMGNWLHGPITPASPAADDAHAVDSRVGDTRIVENGNVASPTRDAIAATVIEAMRARFGGEDVEFRFEAFRSEQGSLRDLSLSGAGQVRPAGGDAWLPVLYSALFDRITGEILAPRVEFDTSGDHAAATGMDRASLDAAVDLRLASEFESQAPEFELADLKLLARDARYVLVAGSGQAEFAGEGTADVAVQAVYDRRAGAWLDVRYTLG